MFSPPHGLDALRRIAETLLVAAAGGVALGLLGVPAGWLSGAMLAVSLWALIKRPLFIPTPLAQIVFVILGISLGAAITPAAIGRMASWPVSLAVLAIAMTTVTAAVMFYLRAVHGWDLLSALFAASPGALSQTLALAMDTNADQKAIATVQSVRLLILTVALPIGLASFAATGGPPPATSGGAWNDSPGELALLVTASSLAAVAARRLRIPGALIVGPMLTSGLLHGSGWVDVTVPSVVANTSFVVLGAAIGTRFAGIDIGELKRLLATGLGALAVATLVTLAFALGVAGFLSLPIGDVILAYAPGGFEAMTILAFALNLDPAFVGVHHFWRFFFVSTLVPVVTRILVRRRDRAGDKDA